MCGNGRQEERLDTVHNNLYLNSTVWLRSRRIKLLYTSGMTNSMRSIRKVVYSRMKKEIEYRAVKSCKCCSSPIRDKCWRAANRQPRRTRSSN